MPLSRAGAVTAVVAVAVTTAVTQRHSLTHTLPLTPQLPLLLRPHSLTRHVCLCDSSSNSSSGSDGARQLSFEEFSAAVKSSAAQRRATHRHSHTHSLTRPQPSDSDSDSDTELVIWEVAGRPGAQSIELKLPRGGGERVSECVSECVSGWVAALSAWLRVLASHGSVELHSQGSDGRVVSFVAVRPGGE